MSLASVKARMGVGTRIEMVHHDWCPAGNPTEKLSGVREVIKAQTNAVQFSGGSWLYWPKAACVRETVNGFEVALNDAENFSGPVMRYEWR